MSVSIFPLILCVSLSSLPSRSNPLGRGWLGHLRRRLGRNRPPKVQLAASFEMKDLGDLHYFLGIEVIRTLEDILIS